MASKSKSCNENPYKGCNRKPFVSDSSCDRGQVDVRMFDELPYCEPIDPIKPQIPPQVVDHPVEMEIPPPCNCIEIGGSIKASKIGRERNSFGFRAVGDCCDGQYLMDLTVPCPITSKGKNKISINIGYASDFSGGSASFVECGPSSCEVEFKDADINLTIPDPTEIMPPEEPYEMEPVFPGAEPGAGLHLTLKCGKKTIASAGADFITKTRNAGKMMTARTKALNLELKCPVKKLTKFNPKIKLVAVQRLKKILSSSQSFLDINSSMCSVTAKDVSFNLDLPCPLKNKKGSCKIKLSVKQKNVSIFSSSKSFADINSSQCEISVKNVSFSLDLPCPIKEKKTSRIKLSVKLGGYNVFSSSQSFADMSSSHCEINVKDVSFGLDIPCPVRSDPAGKNPKIKVRYMKTKSSEAVFSCSYAEMGKSSCAVTLKSVELDLRSIIGGGGGDAADPDNISIDITPHNDQSGAGNSSEGKLEIKAWNMPAKASGRPTSSTSIAKDLSTGSSPTKAELVCREENGTLSYKPIGTLPGSLTGPFEPLFGANGSLVGIGPGYVQIGGYTLGHGGGLPSSIPGGDSFICIRCTTGASSSPMGRDISIEVYPDGDLSSKQNELDYVTYPLYKVSTSDGVTRVVMDLRRMPTMGMLETFL